MKILVRAGGRNQGSTQVVPLRTRLADATRGNRDIRMEHLYSFRVEVQGENGSFVESPSVRQTANG